MGQDNEIQTKPRRRSSRTIILLAIGVSFVVALSCFIALAVMPEPEASRLKDPLRSFLTGLGVLGVAAPLCIAGLTLRKRFASSPYFEGTFIATVLSLFGFVTLAAGLACILLGSYDLALRLMDSTPH